MAGHRSDMMKLVRKAGKHGCTVTRLGNGHWLILTPSGQRITAPFSPSRPGAYRDTVRDLRRAGVKL